jgi:hypothetical protein
MSVDALIARVAGEDNALLFADDAGNAYRLVPVGDALSITKNGAVVGGVRRKVTAKTAAYTCTVADCGTIFTNRGASGSVTFTLPTPVGNSGLWFDFFVVADQNVVITGGDELVVTFNNATADGVTFGTSSEKIGAGATVISDGTSWLVQLHAEETASLTVTDA